MISFTPDYYDTGAKAEFGEGAVAYFAAENGVNAGKCVFSVEGSMATFHLLEADRLSFAAEGLIRASLNCAAGMGAYTARVPSALNGDDFVRLGFKSSGQELAAEIPDILMGGCAQ